MDETPLFLDTVEPLAARVGYGELGCRGSLGYEGKRVTVRGQVHEAALSTHPPARLEFHLGGRYSRFASGVALNDDVPAGRSHADFLVLADGRRVAVASHVRAGDPPRELVADVRGAQRLELVVETSRWPLCHAVWLAPQVSNGAPRPQEEALSDCLGRVEILPPFPSLSPRRCLATVVSPGFEPLLEDLLGSFHAHGECPEARLVVFTVGESAAIDRLAVRYRATLVRCRPASRINPTLKSLLYSIARVIDAEQFLCLDADMLVLESLQPLFAALEACPPGSLLVCREGNGGGFSSVQHALCTAYGGAERDLARILGQVGDEGRYPFVVNDGLMAGGRAAFLALDGCIRAMPGAISWVDERRDIGWRNQLVFNLALARLGCGVELDPAYNLQLHVQDVELSTDGGRLAARWNGRAVRVLHFSGCGRRKYPEIRNRFARVADPLVGPGDGDGYGDFLSALRRFIGRHGVDAVTWSFYGTTDGRSARVRDPSTFPLLALLHYLIRANGCVRVLETGTARGISAACLASAVAHREGGQVVSFDPWIDERRHELWAELPAPLQGVLEARQAGSLEGMRAALEAGERYEAALLDSVHTAEHVWAEFELASRLVCPGGLILIHDACYPHGTVAAALARIEAAGYGVTRLWTAEAGVPEDDRLGLAVIENRPKAREEILDSGNGKREEHATPVVPAVVGGGSLPLVSCLMPTRDRADFVLQSIRYFERQDYPERELIIVDDGDDDLASRLPADPRIRYVKLDRPASIGAKRNRALAEAKGEILAQWDDDDWYAPGRLSAQAAPLLRGEADITGLLASVFFHLPDWTFWTCTPELHRRLFVGDVHGGTLVYRREVARRSRYPDRSLAEDALFLREAQRKGARLLRLDDPGLFLYLRHATNAWSFVCGRHVDPAGWRRIPEPELPAADRAFYAALSPAAPAPAETPPAETPTARREAQGERAAAGGPLVSCIMPTYNRRRFVPRALACFLRQDYPDRELVIVDDGTDPIEDLIPDDPRIRYLRLPGRQTLGTKRNLACRQARGEILVHWDDDDWSAADRLSLQVAALADGRTDVCGLDRPLFYDPATDAAWQYVHPAGDKRWLYGATLAYTRARWERQLFPDVNIAEDNAFVSKTPAARLKTLPRGDIHVALVHPGNTSPKHTRGACWRPVAVERVHALLGADLAEYCALAAGTFGTEQGDRRPAVLESV